MANVKKSGNHNGRVAFVEQLLKHLNRDEFKESFELFSTFAVEFLSNIAERDLDSYQREDLCGLLASFWKFMVKREQQETLVRVYNPSYEVHGWESKYTIVEVVTKDRPFLVDSVLMEINRQGFMQNLVIHYGGLKVKREKNVIQGVKAHHAEKVSAYGEEAPMHIEINKQSDPEVLQKLEQGITKVLKDVEVVVDDWATMRAKVCDVIKHLEQFKNKFNTESFSEAFSFVKWIEDNHFTFLAYRHFELKGEKLIPVEGESLGVLRGSDDKSHVRSLSDMTEAAQEAVRSKNLLIITKTNTPSTVHRPVYTDRIWIKEFNSKGEVCGIFEVVGLYTSVAYNTNPKLIPYIRSKVNAIFELSGIKINSHAGKALINIIETLPTEDLFQATVDELLEICIGILQIHERRQIRLFTRFDLFGKFVSCLVYIPRERFNTELRIAIQSRLEEEFGSQESNYFTRFSDSVLIRTHFIIRTTPEKQRHFDLERLEQSLVEIAKNWSDELKSACLDAFGDEEGHHHYYRYEQAFSSAYKESVLPRSAVHDIKALNLLSEENTLELNFYQKVNASEGEFRFKIYQYQESIPLSEVIPILENMGLKVINEQCYQLHFAQNGYAYINDFALKLTMLTKVSLEDVKDNFQIAFSKVWFGQMESDNFNKLILYSKLDWREVSVLRAYAKYLRQTGFTFSQSYIEETFAQYPEIILNLVQLFHLRFNPEKSKGASKKLEKLFAALDKQVDSVTSLDDDRILRRYREIILATLRTNFYRVNSDNQFRSFISLKFEPEKISDLPLPRPKYEVFVYSPDFEGVHLRSSKVARGGLRWSDRREDFRTEILGLMKAQTVKNAVIVPSGAKGGFVVKTIHPDMDRESFMKAGVACYQNFIRGLLDLADNMKDDMLVQPENCVAYDDPDPYLVVAADKGTATFSDYANAISDEYGFWLSDAFASGGSAGYDHKKMGITAKGAWESVKRHFRELGVDTQSQEFTVVGIGDMAGDVFGNGMLLSKHIKLVAAFNHMHIFIDPNPDAERSYDERERLFQLPRSSWEDYDRKLISQGGGIYSRAAKTIKITPEIAKRFKIKQDYMSPNDLIRAILLAPIDLLWNGGIGTFVKSSIEKNGDVGDRANDAIRIDAEQLQFKVVGEGGNLGMTQLARAEFALKANGKVYSDFIDNSAGVDCSDNEVNIKILLNELVVKGDLTLKQRNKILESMTDDVSEIVLKHNYRQTQAVSITAQQAHRNLELHASFIRALEDSGMLDRELEFLPDDKILAERKISGRGLVAPSISVLLAYSKTQIKNALIKSDVPEDPYMTRFLLGAFPQYMQDTYEEEIKNHPLKREIIATQLSNLLVNEMGFVFAYRLLDETGAPFPVIVKAFIIIRELFQLPEVWQQIEALDNKVSSTTQYEMFSKHIRLIRRSTRWLLKNFRMHIEIEQALTDFQEKFAELNKTFSECLTGTEEKELAEITQSFINKGVSRELAEKLGMLPALMSAFDIVVASTDSGYSIREVAKTYFLLSNNLDIGWLRKQVVAHPVDSNWDAMTREGLRDDIDWQQRQLTVSILDFYHQRKIDSDDLEAWIHKYAVLVKRWEKIISELKAHSVVDFAMFFVAIRELLDLTQTSTQRDVIKREAS